MIRRGPSGTWSATPPRRRFRRGDLTPDETGVIPLPDADVPEEVNVAAKALLRDLGKTQCLTCHIIGTKGAYIGPDLSRLGAWGIDQEFLEEWIKRASGPNAMPHDERMPIYWSQNRAITSTEIDLSERVVSEGPYYMPAFEGRLTDEEISIIARVPAGAEVVPKARREMGGGPCGGT